MVIIYGVVVPQNDLVFYNSSEFKGFSSCYMNRHNIGTCPEDIYFRIKSVGKGFKVEPVPGIRSCSPVPGRAECKGGIFIICFKRFKEAIGKEGMFSSFNLYHLLIHIIETE